MVPFTTKLLNAEIAFQAAFLEGIESLKENIDIQWPLKTQKVTLPGTEEAVYGFLAEMPLFRKWVGERRAKRPKVGSYSLKVDDFELEYAIHRNDIKYDKFGIVGMHIRSGGVAQRRFYEDNQVLAQVNGTTSKCFDGQNFYDTSHPPGLDGTGTVFKNLWTALPLTADNIATVYQYMAQIPDANGNRFGIRPNLIEYGPDLMAAAKLALEADFLAAVIKNVAATENVAAASQSNVFPKGLLTPVLNLNLPAGAWYLHDTRFMMPFLIQEETPPTGLEMRVDPTDPHVWDFNEFLFGARATAGFGYTLPHLSTKVVTT
jgi:phage major head subunit gpT-like protein